MQKKVSNVQSKIGKINLNIEDTINHGKTRTDMDIELTNERLQNVERCGEFTSKESNIRLGITGGGCKQ